MFFPFLYHIVSTQKMCSGILSPGRLEFHLLIPLLIPTLSFRGPLSHLSFATPSKELPWWLSGKESTCQCRRCGFDPWLRKIPWKKKGQLTPLCLPGKSHGQRSLVGFFHPSLPPWLFPPHLCFLSFFLPFLQHRKVYCRAKQGEGFPGGSVVKNPPANAGDTDSIPGPGRSPGERNGNPFPPVFLPEKSHGQRSHVG